jgi:hypothetical protein
MNGEIEDQKGEVGKQGNGRQKISRTFSPFLPLSLCPFFDPPLPVLPTDSMA